MKAGTSKIAKQRIVVSALRFVKVPKLNTSLLVSCPVGVYNQMSNFRVRAGCI